VLIADQTAWYLIPGEGFRRLLRDPNARKKDQAQPSSPTLCGSVAQSKRMRFSIHTGACTQEVPE
jgi:hypothetical protein